MAFDDRHIEILVSIIIFGIATAIAVPLVHGLGFGGFWVFVISVAAGLFVLFLISLLMRSIDYFNAPRSPKSSKNHDEDDKQRP